MKRLYPTVVLTGLLTLALGLSACSSWRGNEGSGASGTSGAAGATGSSDGSTIGARAYATQSGAIADQSGVSAASGASGAAGATGSSASDAQDLTNQRAGAPAVASTTPNSTVISIEPPASSSSTGSSTSGTSGASGAAGSEQAYRITLRMDDGSTQVVSQATAPTYRSGDRVNLSSGVISR